MYAGGVNFTSLLFMNVYRIYILLVWFDKKGENCFWVYLWPFVDDLTKRGREIWSFIYACLFFIYMHVYFISLFYTKRGEAFWEFIYACLFFQLVSVHICFVHAKSILHLCIYVLFVLCIHWISLLFIAMLELRGSFYET